MCCCCLFLAVFCQVWCLLTGQPGGRRQVFRQDQPHPGLCLYPICSLDVRGFQRPWREGTAGPNLGDATDYLPQRKAHYCSGTKQVGLLVNTGGSGTRRPASCVCVSVVGSGSDSSQDSFELLDCVWEVIQVLDSSMLVLVSAVLELMLFLALCTDDSLDSMSERKENSLVAVG